MATDASTQRPPAGADDVEPRSVRIARLLEASSQAFFALDAQAHLSALNRAMAGMLGRPQGELLGRPLAELVCPADRGAVAASLARVQATGEPLRVELAVRRGDGRDVPVEMVFEPDDAGAGRQFAFVHDLTERKLVENALRESEKRFRDLYDEAPVGYHEVDTAGRLVSINRTECELLGYAREELIGRSVFDILSAENREAARRAFPDKVAGRIPLRPFERTVVTRDGRSLILAIEERYKHDDHGEVVGLRTSVRDVTDRKRAEEALLASERRMRALFEGMGEAVLVHDDEGRILDANPAACRLLGYSRDEFLSLDTSRLAPDGPPAVAAARPAPGADPGARSYECRHRTREGRMIPVEVNTSTIQIEGRRATLAVIRDISERLALEDARLALAMTRERNAREIEAQNAKLTLSEARYRRLTEGCLDGVVAADGRGLVTLFNPAAGRIFGYEPAEVVGRPLSQLMPETFADFPPPAGASHPLLGQTAEVVGRRKGGEPLPIELSLGAVEVGGEAQYVASLRDQTERHRMRAALAQSEKLASIGLLSAGVAHEINNPLAYVGNNLAVLERDFEGLRALIGHYEEARSRMGPESLGEVDAVAEEIDWEYIRENLPRMLARTRDGVQRVAQIVSNLRGLARTAPPKMEPASVADLVDGALEMLRGRLRRHHIEARVSLQGAPKVCCVPAQISQVLLNLLINAAQAVEATGREDGGRIEVTAAAEGEFLVVTVADDGVGIPPEHLSRLFDPFFTTKGVGEGTGLGLAISHGIVSGHGGRIDVMPRPGGGTSFRVSLPLQQP